MRHMCVRVRHVYTHEGERITAIGERGIIGGESLTERELLRLFLRRFFAQGDIGLVFGRDIDTFRFLLQVTFSPTLFFQALRFSSSACGKRRQDGGAVTSKKASGMRCRRPVN